VTKHDRLLEPFDAETLAIIQTAFKAGWHELCNGAPVANPAQLRNRLLLSSRTWRARVSRTRCI
jgi:hypothetical protein